MANVGVYTCSVLYFFQNGGQAPSWLALKTQPSSFNILLSISFSQRRRKTRSAGRRRHLPRRRASRFQNLTRPTRRRRRRRLPRGRGVKQTTRRRGRKRPQRRPWRRRRRSRRSRRPGRRKINGCGGRCTRRVRHPRPTPSPNPNPSLLASRRPIPRLSSPSGTWRGRRTSRQRATSLRLQSPRWPHPRCP